MAAIDFPNSPSNGSTYTVGGVTWTYNSSKSVWNITSTGAQGIQGRQGTQGTTGAQASQGWQGTIGTQGKIGTQGNTGTAASQGAQGTQGVRASSSRVSSATTTSTLSWNSTTHDSIFLTQQAGALIISVDSAGASAVDGQRNIFRIKCVTSGALTLSSGSYGLRAFGVTVPTNLTAGNTLYLDCVYNSTDLRWDIINLKEVTV